MVKIYKLIRNNEVVYIGKTILTLQRRKNGAYTAMDKQFVKECDIELIEETDDVSRERYWIEYYRNQGCELKNKRNGDYRDDEQRNNRRRTGNKRGRPKTLSEEQYKENRKKDKKKWYENNKLRISEQRKEETRNKKSYYWRKKNGE